MVAIGVGGHRFLAEKNKVIHGIDHALLYIEKQFDPPYSIISSLAEGADRWVVHRAFLRWPEVQFHAILPMPLEEYLKDFSSFTSKADFINLLEQAETVVELENLNLRAEAYSRAGHRILDLCHVLVTVWDGKAPQGQGGTGEMVATAREKGLPIAWVHAGNRVPGTTNATSLGKMQGEVSFERF